MVIRVGLWGGMLRTLRAPHSLRLTIYFSLLTAYCLLLTACAAPPIEPIGVLAPFEGLYRRSGYAALDVVRAEIEAGAGAGVLPLALDTSRDAARAMQKLVAMTTGQGNGTAVVGPLTPQDGAASAGVLAGVPWYAPWAVSSRGLEDPGSDEWLVALLDAVAADARAIGAQSLVAAGWEGERPSLASAGEGGAVAWIDSPLAVRSGDGVLWLGDAAGGARFVSALRARLPGTPIWLGPWAVDPVLFEHLRAAGFADWERLYWITWLDQEYPVWAEAHVGASPMLYLTQQAARRALASVTDAPLPAQEWYPFVFAVAQSGESVPAHR